MIPVTSWTRKVKQPRGGYLPVKSMRAESFDDRRVLNSVENLSAGTVGTSVDYLSRVLSGHDAHEVFALPLAGAEKLGRQSVADKYLSEIIMFADDGVATPELIHAGVNLSRFDIAFKTGNERYLDALNGAVAIDDDTAENIAIMVDRILVFRYRHNILNAESKQVYYKSFPGLTGADCLSGEIDVSADDSLWDCKAMSTKLRATYTAQILAYYVMLFHVNGRDMQSDIARGCLNPNRAEPVDFTLGFFNPRENCEYTIRASEIDPLVFTKLADDMVNPLYMY